MISHDDCVEWDGATNHNGYGTRTVNGRSGLVHRFAWAEANGPIPEGKYVLHKCDNPPCFNVDHLFIGDQFDNMRDMVEKGRNSGPEYKTHCKRGHALTPENKRPIGKSYQCRECGRQMSRDSHTRRKFVLLGLLAASTIALLGCPPGPVTPLPPDASDASPPPTPIGDADPYAACCAKMHDATPECPLTLAHIVQTHITSVPAACSTCGLGCR
jgi:hypothetical protein